MKKEKYHLYSLVALNALFNISRYLMVFESTTPIPENCYEMCEMSNWRESSCSKCLEKEYFGEKNLYFGRKFSFISYIFILIVSYEVGYAAVTFSSGFVFGKLVEKDTLVGLISLISIFNAILILVQMSASSGSELLALRSMEGAAYGVFTFLTNKLFLSLSEVGIFPHLKLQKNYGSYIGFFFASLSWTFSDSFELRTINVVFGVTSLVFAVLYIIVSALVPLKMLSVSKEDYEYVYSSAKSIDETHLLGRTQDQNYDSVNNRYDIQAQESQRGSIDSEYVDAKILFGVREKIYSVFSGTRIYFLFLSTTCKDSMEMLIKYTLPFYISRSFHMSANAEVLALFCCFVLAGIIASTYGLKLSTSLASAQDERFYAYVPGLAFILSFCFLAPGIYAKTFLMSMVFLFFGIVCFEVWGISSDIILLRITYEENKFGENRAVLYSLSRGISTLAAIFFGRIVDPTSLDSYRSSFFLLSGMLLLGSALFNYLVGNKLRTMKYEVL
eukprot:snap_masked-scaffold_6-processed-gene-11.40-mRNA-1 protein AED:1.00 eAED:1.00 QI:0/0/0/0/1/1/2/0/500